MLLRRDSLRIHSTTGYDDSLSLSRLPAIQRRSVYVFLIVQTEAFKLLQGSLRFHASPYGIIYGLDMPLHAEDVSLVAQDRGLRSILEAFLYVHPNRKSDLFECEGQPAEKLRVGSVGHGLLPATQRVSVWTRRWGEIPQPLDEYAWRAVLPYTAPLHT
jgi:hypothetical protein